MCMSKKKLITKETVELMVRLSNLKMEPKELDYFTGQFDQTLDTINELNRLDTKNVPGTSQVTGLTNIFREDIVEKERMFSQKEALSNAKKTYMGYFLVKAVFDEQ